MKHQENCPRVKGREVLFECLECGYSNTRLTKDITHIPCHKQAIDLVREVHELLGDPKTSIYTARKLAKFHLENMLKVLKVQTNNLETLNVIYWGKVLKEVDNVKLKECFPS